MPSNYSVFTKVFNTTKETLVYDSAGTVIDHGDWYDLPARINPGSQGAFSLQGRSGALYGSEGTFSFFIQDGSQVLSKMASYQTDPIQVGGNKVTAYPPTPQALYAVTFRSSTTSAEGPWTEGTVNPDGHPFWVEYTLKYQPKRYRFRLIHIAAKSFHFVRNTKKKLIYGSHALWDYATPNANNDGTAGSFQPNLFQYDFTTPVPQTSTLSVTVRPVDIELEGAEAAVVGYIGTTRVFLSEYFRLKVNTDQTVAVRVVSPNKSSMPFAWNDDVTWGLILQYSGQSVDPVPGTPYITRLELYWISSRLHRALKNEIPLGLLRDVLGRRPRLEADAPTPDKSVAAPTIHTSGYYAYVTNAVFGEFSKIYDTVSGASQFGLSAQGGIFNERYYRARAPEFPDNPGSLWSPVNCMDQAAMLELSCSFWEDPALPRPTSWLLQQPFGFINRTHLVGVASLTTGALLDVNNPFFGTNYNRALVDINDPGRTWFGCHVYVGFSNPFDRQNDGIFDACSGPHTGTEDPQGYVTAAIDVQTNLYTVNHTQPGTVGNIAQGQGVIGIDGHYPTLADRGKPADYINTFRPLLDRLAPAPAKSTVTHVNWASLADWVASALGASWSAPFADLAASEGIVEGFWHLADAQSAREPVRVRVVTVSLAGANGAFDLAASANAARTEVLAIIAGSDANPESLWVAGTFGDFGDYSLQYASGLAAGRVIVVAANTFVDISGKASTAALDGIARKLLTKVVRRGAPQLAFPAVEYQGNGDQLAVAGLYTPFSASFSVVGQLSTVGATCTDAGVVFEDGDIIEVAGGNSTVKFNFVSRDAGTHEVRVHCADALTMVCSTKVLKVNVTESTGGSA